MTGTPVSPANFDDTIETRDSRAIHGLDARRSIHMEWIIKRLMIVPECAAEGERLNQRRKAESRLTRSPCRAKYAGWPRN